MYFKYDAFYESLPEHLISPLRALAAQKQLFCPVSVNFSERCRICRQSSEVLKIVIQILWGSIRIQKVTLISICCPSNLQSLKKGTLKNPQIVFFLKYECLVICEEKIFWS